MDTSIVGAEAFSLGQPSANFGGGGPEAGTPNTFIFGFSGVGGDPIVGPAVISLLPSKGGNAGAVSVIIHGSKFEQGATAQLLLAGETEIVGDPTDVVLNGFAITTRFDLRGRAPGSWDLRIINPDGKSVTVPKAFTVEQGGAPQVWADIVGRAFIRPNQVQAYSITYG